MTAMLKPCENLQESKLLERQAGNNRKSNQGELQVLHRKAYSTLSIQHSFLYVQPTDVPNFIFSQAPSVTWSDNRSTPPRVHLDTIYVAFCPMKSGQTMCDVGLQSSGMTTKN